jgi:hypothetical protein
VAENCDNIKDYEVRLDMLNLIEHFIHKESLLSTIEFYGEVILKGILIPSIVWKVGMPNVKIRKASIICLMKMVQNKTIDAEKIQDVIISNLNFRTLKN